MSSRNKKGNVKDVTEKKLLQLPDVAADVINAFVFNGEQVIKKEQILYLPPRTSFKVNDSIHEIERDVLLAIDMYRFRNAISNHAI